MVEGGPCGGVEAGRGDDDRRGLGVAEGVPLVVAVADDVEDEDADDDGEKDVVAGAELHGCVEGRGWWGEMQKLQVCAGRDGPELQVSPLRCASVEMTVW